MPLDRALAAISRASCYEAGKIMPLDEVERRVAEQREAVRVLGLGVPVGVRIITPESRTEDRWGF